MHNAGQDTEKKKIRWNFKHRRQPPGREITLWKKNYLHTTPLKVKKQDTWIYATYVLCKYITHRFNATLRIVKVDICPSLISLRLPEANQ